MPPRGGYSFALLHFPRSRFGCIYFAVTPFVLWFLPVYYHFTLVLFVLHRAHTVFFARCYPTHSLLHYLPVCVITHSYHCVVTFFVGLLRYLPPFGFGSHVLLTIFILVALRCWFACLCRARVCVPSPWCGSPRSYITTFGSGSCLLDSLVPGLQFTFVKLLRYTGYYYHCTFPLFAR